MPYQKATIADAESVLPDDARAKMFRLKDPLDTDEVALTLFTMEPNSEGMEHDHGDDGQEEVYYVVEGGVDVDFGDATVSLDEREAIRIDPEESRQIKNRDNYSELVLVGAPR
ncbi:cupin domain-containing protein [Halobacterium bonnevillei]|uniref:Cupin domain-containing protein n=1 Tax=Halobacterium bonnevillei TaxID=2692200 RepID=A0A6B0STQ3_9EURY|nr:cupin domain-containing protein [Halobacterium bonnevillei]MXR22200.1 cupin domain-containing protein [Halobacterium bonnevillei]